MVKKISAILTILTIMILSYGCNSKDSYIKVKDYNFDSVVTKKIIKERKVKGKIDKKYHIVNNNFEVVKEDANCSVLDKYGDFYVNYIFGKGNLNISIKENNKCKVIYSLKNVGAFSNKVIGYKNKLYMNIIFNDKNKPGLYVFDRNKKKLISNYFSMQSDFDIDKEHDILYSLEHNDGETNFRSYKLNGQLINTISMNEDNYYRKLFVKDNMIYLVDDLEIKEDYQYEFYIDSYNFDDVFSKVNTRDYAKRKIIGDLSSSFTTFYLNDSIISTYSSEYLVCNLDNNKCNKFDGDNFPQILNYKYMLVDDSSNLESRTKQYLSTTDNVGKELILEGDNIQSQKIVDNFLYLRLDDDDGKDLITIRYELNNEN